MAGCSYLNLTCSLCKWLFHSSPELLCDGPAASRGTGHLMAPALAAGLLTLAAWAPGRFCKAISLWWHSTHLDFSLLCEKWVDILCRGDKVKLLWSSRKRRSIECYLPSWDQACSGCLLPSLWVASYSAVQLGRNLFQGGGRGKVELVLNPPRDWVACRQLAFLATPSSTVGLAHRSSQDAVYCPI